MKPLSEQIRENRKEQKMTQAKLAELSGASRQTIISLEKGGNVGIWELEKVARALNLSFVALKRKLPTIDELDEVLGLNESKRKSGRK